MHSHQGYRCQPQFEQFVYVTIGDCNFRVSMMQRELLWILSRINAKTGCANARFCTDFAQIHSSGSMFVKECVVYT